MFRPRIRPAETDAPLIIDTDTVLTGTVALECFKMIAGRHPQVIKPTGDFKLPEFTPRDLGDIDEPLDTPALCKCFGVFTFKRADYTVDDNVSRA
jgi:hypothetical protein